MAVELLDQIRSAWHDIRSHGAFVFDIDETLMSPDHTLQEAPDAAHVLEKLLAAGMRVALISGSPGAVLVNRVVQPLQQHTRVQTSWLERLTLYVNGGTSKWVFNAAGHIEEQTEFSEKHLISAEEVEKIRKAVESAVHARFGWDEETFGNIYEAWQKKRDRQWQGKPVLFKEIFPGSGGIELLDDTRMAQMKAGQKHPAVKVSYPFINTRGIFLESDGRLRGVSGITPTGFYVLSKAQGDNFDLDLRDKLIEMMEVKLGSLNRALALRKAGRSSVDITRAGSDKASALLDYLQTHALRANAVYYFGDEFYDGGNDQPIAENEALRMAGLKIVALNHLSAPQYHHVQWLGKSTHDLHLFFKSILI